MGDSLKSGCQSTREGFACTRARAHKGLHAARGLGGILLRTWAPKKAKS